jgi:BirA family biotin operon repressor/biotin-[acetyl-CoA-carboxylase] ligase
MRVSGTLVNMGIGRLNAEILEAKLKACSVGHTVEYHTSVASTMPLARRLAIDPETKSGAIVIAEEQTAGRGRSFRDWEAPYGDGLLLTILLKPPLLPSNPAQLPMIAGISIVEAIGQILPSAAGRLALKWPNDVLMGRTYPHEGNRNDTHLENTGLDINGAGKVAGILIESAYQGPTMDYALLGIGINVNQQAGSLRSIAEGAVPATSIREQVGRPIDRTELCIALCVRLADWLSSAQMANGQERVYQRWLGLLTTLGHTVTVHHFDTDHVQTGRAVDADRNGSLIIEDSCGCRHMFEAGDVTLN